VVTMHLPGVGLLDFERAREVAAMGYTSSSEEIAAWAADRADLGAGVTGANGSVGSAATGGQR